VERMEAEDTPSLERIALKEKGGKLKIIAVFNRRRKDPLRGIPEDRGLSLAEKFWGGVRADYSVKRIWIFLGGCEKGGVVTKGERVGHMGGGKGGSVVTKNVSVVGRGPWDKGKQKGGKKLKE